MSGDALSKHETERGVVFSLIYKQERTLGGFPWREGRRWRVGRDASRGSGSEEAPGAHAPWPDFQRTEDARARPRDEGAVEDRLEER
jgi:hypothetical protein